MKLKARKDIEAPVADTFRLLTDFDGYERAALRQGAEVERLDAAAGSPVAIGSGWKVGFVFRGRRRVVTSRVSELDPPHALAFDGDSQNFALSLRADLVQLSRNHTRVAVELELRPRSFSGRVILQTLKLARSRVEARFEARIETFAAMLQRRLREDRRG